MHREAVKGITVDAESTRDIDDAVWIERVADRWVADISISDVATEIEAGSDADRAARALVATKYSAHDFRPMFPKVLSEHELSLWPHRPRRTLTVRIELSAGFDVIRRRVFLSELVSHAKLHHAEVGKLLGKQTHPLQSAIVPLVVVGAALRERRRQRGALVFDDVTNGWVTSEEGRLRRLGSSDEALGYCVVQELMILANEEFARYAIENDIPILFRTHTASASAPPREELQAELESVRTLSETHREIVRERSQLLLGRAAYDVSAKPHFGLHLPVYTHLTSPIRRYADLASQRQIVAHLIGRPSPYGSDELAELSRHINTKTEALRESRAESFRRRAEERASIPKSPEELRHLSAKEFERTLKVAYRSGEPAPSAFATAFVERFEDGTLPLVCVSCLFAEAPREESWQNLKRISVELLARRPADATSVLAQGTNIAGWPAPTFTVSEQGLEHAKQFTAIGTLKLPSMTAISASFEASTAKEAKQRAAVGILAVLAEMVTPQFQSPSSAGSGKNPVAALLEYAQAEQVAAPTYEFEGSGPSHEPSFVCTCHFRDVLGTGRAGTKQIAKKLAAESVLQLLSNAGSGSRLG